MADVKYRDRHKIAGQGIIYNSDRTQSVRVFYVFETYESNIGDRFHQMWMPRIDALEVDFNKAREPAWLDEFSILETDRDGKFKIKRRIGFWEVYRLDDESTSEEIVDR